MSGANPTRECLPLVIQLMPYYAQFNELSILKEIHSKMCDPQKRLHQRMVTEAIAREQCAIKTAFGLGVPLSFSQLAKLPPNLNGSVAPLPGTSLTPTNVPNFFGIANGVNPLGALPESMQMQTEDDVIVVENEDGEQMGGGKARKRTHSVSFQQQNGLGNVKMAVGCSINSNNCGGLQQQNNNTSANDPLAKRRADFLREASTLYNNKYRMLSRSVYEFYIKRLKITQNLDPRLLLKKDMEIRNKFELSIFVENGVAMERLVERNKDRRKLVAIEEVFDMVHFFHERLGHGKRMAIYDAIKREYANITLNCVLLYMAGCQGCYSTGSSSDPAQLPGLDNNSSQLAVQEPMPRAKQFGTAEKTVESRAAKLGLDEIDYSEHFVIGEDEIRCRHCHFIYFHKSRQRPRHSLRSHLRNYHRKLFNQMMEQGCEQPNISASPVQIQIQNFSTSPNFGIVSLNDG